MSKQTVLKDFNRRYERVSARIIKIRLKLADLNDN
jgi:hypothetical protein